MTANRRLARELADQSVTRGQPLDWFEALYVQAKGDPHVIPWADLSPNPNLTSWLNDNNLDGDGRTALVVGCGLGDDAEALASLGFSVTAFDISSTCVEWSRRRFPDTRVRYLEADLFQCSDAWSRAFDFVFEAYTLQVLPPQLRPSAAERISDFVSPSGALLVITRARGESDSPGQMPWPLLRFELDRFISLGLREELVEDYVDTEDPPVRRFRALYTRAWLTNRT